MNCKHHHLSIEEAILIEMVGLLVMFGATIVFLFEVIKRLFFTD